MVKEGILFCSKKQLNCRRQTSIFTILKTLIHLFLLIISAATVTSCQRQPKANFTTDKGEYSAGEIIHFTDISSAAKGWKWTSPYNQIYNSKDLEYAIDSDDLGGNESFSLEVFSKNGKKSDIISKSITINQYILPSDYFSTGSIVYKPIMKKCGYKVATEFADSWQVKAIDKYPESATFVTHNLYIFFSDTIPPQIGTYNLQPNHSSIPDGNASIVITVGSDEAGYSNYASVSGTLVVTLTTTGKVHIVFNNIPTAFGNISGDITCH